MAGMNDLFGKGGAVEQLMLWNTAGQVISTIGQPAFTALLQDVMAKHPNQALTPDVLARAVVQTFIKATDAKSEAAKSGMDASRFDIMLKLAQVRIQPADLAEAYLRSYKDLASAEAEAAEQGVDAERFAILALLAGDGIGPQQAAMARRRGIIGDSGTGPGSTSYEQAIAESRLHNKWADALYELTQALLSPADAAEAVVRGFLAPDAGLAIADLSGVSAVDFNVMVSLAGDAPSPTELAEALRRKIIPFDSGDPDEPGFVQGIRQGRLANKWTDMIERLAQEWPTPTDALEARLVGQITDTESQALYATFGGDPQYWQLLFETRGESPTPLELGVLANRGVIPWDGTGPDKTTFTQGFNEGRWRDKWRDVYRELAKYRPPESTITLFLSHGIITDDDAADSYTKLGMDQQTVAQFVAEAHLEAYSDYRGATVSTILQAYHDQLLTPDQAAQILTDLHVDPNAVLILLELQDIQRAFASVNNAVSRVRTLYAARKITEQTATDTLDKLGIPPTSVQGMLRAWQLENSISVRTLTEAQIVSAWELQILNYDQALTELGNIGYTPFDAWVLLSIKAKQVLPGAPTVGPPPTQGAVVPGTT